MGRPRKYPAIATQTTLHANRRAALAREGVRSVVIELPNDVIESLDAMCEEEGVARRKVIERLIREAALPPAPL